MTKLESFRFVFFHQSILNWAVKLGLSKLKNKLKIKKEKKYESKTIQEVHEIIIDAVLLVCDMTREQVENLIDDDIYEVL